MQPTEPPTQISRSWVTLSSHVPDFFFFLNLGVLSEFHSISSSPLAKYFSRISQQFEREYVQYLNQFFCFDHTQVFTLMSNVSLLKSQTVSLIVICTVPTEPNQGTQYCATSWQLIVWFGIWSQLVRCQNVFPT